MFVHLIAIDENGNESTIYVADSSQIVANIAIILMIAVFVFLVINKTKEKITLGKVSEKTTPEQSGDG